MRLSELVDWMARLRTGDDPELMIEDQDGVPCPVVGADLGLTYTGDGVQRYVVLVPARDGED